ncbi:hypothetical protein [Pseudoalteromonas sp. 5-MNA-CIBAN-0065]|uniref:hypothetical protein n=1 Tax=Pseudoalteromonas sp. 5-MNA-CIBAN-0065 TaxID=3140421 RepID=UPI00332914A0
MILKVLGWFFGVSFLISGISSLFTGDVITGLILLLATAICLPPLLSKINTATKGKVEITQGKAVIAGIVLLFIAVAFATPPPPLTPEQKAAKAEQAKTEKIKQAQQARIKKEMDDRKLAKEKESLRIKTEKIEREKAEELAAEREEECKSDYTHYYMAKKFVKRYLKSPSTAEFPSSNDSDVRVEYVGNCVHKIWGYVDSQNSFGAIIRTPYYVEIKNEIVDDKWSLLDINM